LLVGATLAFVGMPTLASTRVAVYAIIDDIELEPSSFEPERAWISGVFVVPTPVSSGLHEAPVRGHLYFSLNPAKPDATRRDWEELRAVAGTSNPVGFGQYWMPCAQSRWPGFPHSAASDRSNCSFEATVQSDRTRATPEDYPIPSDEGVVLDHDDDACPRFGRPSMEIVAELRDAHSPGGAHDDPPPCAEWVGLLASSDLDAAFARQARDRDWAEGSETMILQRLARAPGLELADLGVQCRETVCRIHLAFPTLEYQEATGNRLAADALDGMPGFAPGGKIDPGWGTPTIDYYFQRRRPAASAVGE
jgi:hypothetical protein